MNHKYYIADAFTQQIFNGAQIAVFPHAEGFSAEQMSNIARELNLSETVFVVHPENKPHCRRIRIFSPLGEKDYAGHAVIATAYVLAYCGDIRLTNPNTVLTFEKNNGLLEVNISANEGRPTFIQFSNQVSSIIDRFVPTDEELASVLSIKVSELDHKKFSPRLVSCGQPYLIIPLWNYDSVRNVRFNYTAWSQSTAPQTAAQEILLFSPKNPFADSDFNLRLVGAAIGPHDDPPVGGVIPAFASYLCSFDFTQQGTHTFTVDRGDKNSRRSLLYIEMDNKKTSQLSFRIGGEAVIFSQGTIFI